MKLSRILIFAAILLTAATVTTLGCSLVDTELTPYDNHAQLER